MDSIVGRNEIEAFLFDFDGTLVHQVIDFALMHQRVREVASMYGVDASIHAGLPTLETVARVEATLGSVDRERSGRFVVQAKEAIIAIEVEAARRAEVLPGVVELMTGLLDGGVKVGIVTRNCRQAVETILARSPIPHQVLLTRDDVSRVKPDPEHLCAALRILGAAPARTVMVGDHPMDVQAGRAAGAWAIGILNDGRPADYFSDVAPDVVLRGVFEISDYLRNNVLT